MDYDETDQIDTAQRVGADFEPATGPATGAPLLDHPRTFVVVPAAEQRRASAVPILVAVLVVVIVFAALAVWAVKGVVFQAREPRRAAPSTSQEATPEPQPVPVVEDDAMPTVEHAQAALERARPALYRQLSDPDEPKVERDDSNTTYTWQYVETGGSSTLHIRTVAVTLDEHGRLVGINRE